jgi:hypothetical protein
METVTLARGANDNGLCVMLEGMLNECAARHGGRLPGLGSRIGLFAEDAGEQATLIFGGGRCTIEDGLSSPDLTLHGSSDLLPRVADVPLRFGLPWLFSSAGRQLLIMALTGQLRVEGLLAGSLSPRRTARALVDLLLLTRLLAGQGAGD